MTEGGSVRLAGEPSSAEPSRWHRASRAGAVHLAATSLAALAIACLPLAANPRFYFADDTQSSAAGAWYEVGRYLVERHELPILLPGHFMAGNILVEGQWGIFNPLALLLSAVTYLTGQLIVVAVVCKVVSLAVLAAGAYLVARSYGVKPRWASAAGLAAPFIGFTMYFDAASWVTGLWVFAGLGWTWWAMRRFRLHGGLPLVPFIFGGLVVTVGYVHGTMMLAAMILGTILEAWLEGDRRGAWRLFAVGVAIGLVAAFVFLPGVLSAKVTWRTGSIGGNDNMLSPEPAALLASMLPSYRPWMVMFSGVGAVAAPLTYVSWMVAAAVFVRWRRGVLAWRGLTAIAVVGLLAAVLAFGPSQVGPLRFPVRLMPYLSLAMILFLVVAVTRLGLVITRGRLALLGLVCLGSTYLAIAKYPQGFPAHFATAAFVLLAVFGIVLSERKRPVLVPVVAGTVTAAVLGCQALLMPAAPVPDFGMPTTAEAYRNIVPSDAGAIYVVGGPTYVVGGSILTQKVVDGTTFGNGWALADRSSLNVYTPVGFAALGRELCLETHGIACSEGASRIFTVDQTTGLTVADLLGVDQVQILFGQGFDPAAAPPNGWHVASSSPASVLWAKDTPAAPVGGVAWSSPGVRLSQVTIHDTQVSFAVDAAPAGGGSVVLSRLAWPGYSTDGGSIAAPLRGYLLNLDIGSAQVGHRVTVSFAPPAWTVTVVLGAGGVIGILAWTVVVLFGAARRRLGSAAA